MKSFSSKKHSVNYFNLCCIVYIHTKLKYLVTIWIHRITYFQWQNISTVNKTLVGNFTVACGVNAEPTEILRMMTEQLESTGMRQDYAVNWSTAVHVLFDLPIPAVTVNNPVYIQSKYINTFGTSSLDSPSAKKIMHNLIWNFENK